MLEIVIGIVVICVLIVLWRSKEHMSGTGDDMQFIVVDSGKPGPVVGILAGMHGNEPAATMELFDMIQRGWFGRVRSGSVRIIPNANPVGLRLGIRRTGLMRGLVNADDGDLNRGFWDGTTDPVILAMVKFFETCDVVIDFHEGWGFHQIQGASMGSTMMGNDQTASNVIRTLIGTVNESDLMKWILTAEPRKAFVELDKNGACDILGTLSCYKRGLGQSHILVETSGQGDVQPMWIRRSQVIVIIESLLRQYGII